MIESEAVVPAPPCNAVAAPASLVEEQIAGLIAGIRDFVSYLIGGISSRAAC